MPSERKNKVGGILLRVQHYLEIIFNPLEKIAHRYVLLPFRWILSKIDPLSEATFVKAPVEVVFVTSLLGRFWDILFGTFHLPKGETPSDDIGIANMPNYPQTFVGLMLAPFTYGQIKREANQQQSVASQDKPEDGASASGTKYLGIK